MKALQSIYVRFTCRHQIEKRIRTLPEIDGLSKETVVTSWMAKYDAIMKGETDKFFLLLSSGPPQSSLLLLAVINIGLALSFCLSFLGDY